MGMNFKTQDWRPFIATFAVTSVIGLFLLWLMVAATPAWATLGGYGAGIFGSWYYWENK